MTWGGGWPKRGARITTAKRVSHSGRSFASKLEAAVYDLLLLREKVGEVREIMQQPTIYITEARIGMRPDYSAIDVKTDELFYIEAKGHESDVWKIKLKLYRWYGPAKLEIYKGTYARPKLDEVVVPKLLLRGTL